MSSYIKANSGCEFNNQSHLPRLLLIYGASANTTHTFRCGAALHAKIVDTSSTIEVYQTIYGRIVGKKAHINAGGVLHADTEASDTAVTGVSADAGTWTAGFDRR